MKPNRMTAQASARIEIEIDIPKSCTTMSMEEPLNELKCRAIDRFQVITKLRSK